MAKGKGQRCILCYSGVFPDRSITRVSHLGLSDETRPATETNPPERLSSGQSVNAKPARNMAAKNSYAVQQLCQKVRLHSHRGSASYRSSPAPG